MKLFKYSCGDIEIFAPAEDEKDAYERREEVNPAFHYLPVVVEELKVEGCEITVQRTNGGDTLETMNRDQLKQWLKSKNIEFTPQWGEDKLREIALQHA